VSVPTFYRSEAPPLNTASISPSSNSLTLGLQNLAGASQNSPNACFLPSSLDFLIVVQEVSNFFKKSAKDLCNSEGAAGWGCCVCGFDGQERFPMKFMSGLRALVLRIRKEGCIGDGEIDAVLSGGASLR